MNLIPALFLSGALSIRFKRRIEETLAPSIFILITILYFAGIFTTLLPGVLSCLSVSAVALYYIIRSFKQNGSGDLKKYFLTPGALALLFYVLFFSFVCAGREFYWRDDLGHWGLSVKNMLYWHELSNIIQSTDRNGTYPPAAALWNYLGALMTPRDMSFFVNRDLTPINDAPSAQLFSQAMLGAALWLPVFSGIGSLKNGGELLRFAFAISAMPMILTGTLDMVWSSAMTDPLMGLLSVYILHRAYRFLRDEETDSFAIFQIAGGLFILALTKEMGTVLAVILTATIIAAAGVKAAKKLALGLTAGTLLAPISWYGYLMVYGRLTQDGVEAVPAGGGGHLSGGLVSLFSNLDPDLSWDVTRDYIYGLNNWHATFGAHVSLTFAGMSFAFAIVIALAAIVKRVVFGIKFARTISGAQGRLVLLVWFAGWVYAGFLLAAYLTVFRSIAATLPSMERYLAPLIVMQLGFFSSVAIDFRTGGKKAGIAVWILVAAFALSLVYGDETAIKNALILREDREAPVYQLRGEIEKLETTFRPGDRLFLVMQDGNISDVRYALGYLVTPAVINKNRYRLRSGGEPLTAAEFEDILDDGYNYLYLKTVSDDFAEIYGGVFAEGEEIRQDAFYIRDETGYFTLFKDMVE